MMMAKFRVHRCATSKALINLFILCSLGFTLVSTLESTLESSLGSTLQSTLGSTLESTLGPCRLYTGKAVTPVLLCPPYSTQVPTMCQPGSTLAYNYTLILLSFPTLCITLQSLCSPLLCCVAASILNINCCVQCEPIAGAPLCHNSHQFPHVSWINLNYPRAIHHPSFHIGRTTGHLFF